MESFGATTGAGVQGRVFSRGNGGLRAQEHVATFCILHVSHTHLAARGPCPTFAATKPGAGGREHPEPIPRDTGCPAAIPDVPVTGQWIWRDSPPAAVALPHRSLPAR